MTDGRAMLPDKTIGELIKRQPPAEGDYYEGGLLYCGKCRTAKEVRMDLPAGSGDQVVARVVSIACSCTEEARVQEKREMEAKKFREDLATMWNSDGLCIHNFQRCSFTADDRKDKKNIDVCRRYVDRWETVRDENIGLLLYGAVGTGKSFAAAAIASALVDKGVRVCVTNFARLLNRLQKVDNRQGLIDSLDKYALLVIDDLGAERDSSYACEQIFNVIDARAQAGLPLIVTTNLSLDELQNPDIWDKKRIYDRILEMCPVHLRMTGESRRKKNAEERKGIAREILLGEK